jgi:beta-alanine degradation protein BauB
LGKFHFDKWPSAPANLSAALSDEFVTHAGDGRVGNKLISETRRVRVWSLNLEPGERIGFHTHALDYFWTSITSGLGRSHYNDGRTEDVIYNPGDIKQLVFKAGELMIHDLENIGDTELIFTTVEFLDSANSPLTLPSHSR